MITTEEKRKRVFEFCLGTGWTYYSPDHMTEKELDEFLGYYCYPWGLKDYNEEKEDGEI